MRGFRWGLPVLFLTVLPAANCWEEGSSGPPAPTPIMPPGAQPDAGARDPVVVIDLPKELQRSIEYVEGECPSLLLMCGHGLTATAGVKCIDLAVFEADGTEVPKTRTYQYTSDCGGNGDSQNPPPSFVTPGVKFLVGPGHPSVIQDVSAAYSKLKRKLDLLAVTDSTNYTRLITAQRDVEAAEKEVTITLINECAGFVYQHNSNPITEPNIKTNFQYKRTVGDGMFSDPMVTTKGLGEPTQLQIWGEALYQQQPYKPDPGIFIASILHEMFHWEQPDMGDDGVDIHKALYELETMEFEAGSLFYNHVLPPGVAETELNAPQRAYWEPVFYSNYNALSTCDKHAVANWAWTHTHMRAYMVWSQQLAHATKVWSALYAYKYEPSCP